MKNKGFTLIELVGVIVILGVIALIVVPIVFNVIENSNRKSAESTLKNVYEAAKLYHSNKEIVDSSKTIIFECENGKCISGEEELKVNGTIPEFGRIRIDADGTVSLSSIFINGYSCSNENNSFKCEKSDIQRIVTSESEFAISDSKNNYISNYEIQGNSIQIGIPSLTNPIVIQSVGNRVENLFNFDNVIGKTSSLTINENDKSISLKFNGTTDAKLGMIGASFAGAPAAYNTYKQIFNINEAGYYCLKVKVTSEIENISPRSNWAMNILGGEAVQPKVVTQTMKDGYLFVKYNFTEEVIEKLPTAETARIYMYAFRKNGTSENVDATISEIMFVKGDYTIDTMPTYHPYGVKYKIPIKVSNGSDIVRTQITIDEPLRKVGNYVDYIDFENKKLVRNIEVIDSTGTLTVENSFRPYKIPIETSIDLPQIPIFKGDSTLTVETEVKPSKIKLQYNK